MINTFDNGTNDRVKTALNSINSTRDRVRIFYGDIATGKVWPEEYDVLGRVGNSNGSSKIAILINNSSSMVGGAILTACVVGIVTTKGKWLYKHEKFSTGEWLITDSDLPEYTTMAWHDGKIHARFKTLKQAENYCKFMRGERFCK
jgi:hypothetical protein